MNNKNNSLNNRMKQNYENRAKTYLVRRSPVVLRLDGNNFHSYTKGFKRPYDEVFRNTMNRTMEYLCKNIQGCKFGYTQSDEITLILTDYDTLTTDAWFDYGVQKMCSIAASMATMAFNKTFADEIDKAYKRVMVEDKEGVLAIPESQEELFHNYFSKIGRALFDARCFNVPKEEIANALIWRQQDATRNAIQMLGQCHFSHKELDKKSNNKVQDMLFLEKGINFNDMPTEFKRGVCCVKDENGKWFIDKEIPIFTKDRDYIEKRVIIKEEEND